VSRVDPCPARGLAQAESASFSPPPHPVEGRRLSVCALGSRHWDRVYTTGDVS
jgi:hypothetical protein